MTDNVYYGCHEDIFEHLTDLKGKTLRTRKENRLNQNANSADHFPAFNLTLTEDNNLSNKRGSYYD